MSRPYAEDTEFDPDRVVVRDKRRLDPETGAVKAGEAAPAASPDPADRAAAEGAALAAEEDALAAELTADLQRITAEYANYRRRVERDRVAVVEMATAGLLAELLPVLDDVDRARQHGDLTGAFAAVGERLEQVVAKHGLEKYGEPGDPFDPAVHEALMQAEPDPTASVPVCAQVFQAGYRLKGGRVLRPARVSVADPAGAGEQPPTGGADGPAAADTPSADGATDVTDPASTTESA